MRIKNGNYELSFENGGVEVCKEGKVLYYNKRPIYAFIKTI